MKFSPLSNAKSNAGSVYLLCVLVLCTKPADLAKLGATRQRVWLTGRVFTGAMAISNPRQQVCLRTPRDRAKTKPKSGAKGLRTPRALAKQEPKEGV